MDPLAIEKSRRRLDDAQRALGDFEASRDFDDLAYHWGGFVHASNVIFTMLCRGIGRDPVARDWLAAKSRERESDELLSYMYHARNADEHSLEIIAEPVPGRLEISVKSGMGSFHLRSITAVPGEPLRIEADRPEAVDVRLWPDALKLLPVLSNARPAVTVNPPRNHLGSPISDRSPLSIGHLFVVYLASLIDEAEHLP